MYQPQDNDPTTLASLRKLHWITFANYWIGFPFFISHSILSHRTFPALGLLPMSISFLLACWRLVKLHKKDGQYQIILGDENNPHKKDLDHLLALADLGIVVGDSLVFIFTCIFTYGGWRGAAWSMLAAYGTVALFVDIAIHAYLWAQEARKMSFKFKKHDCAARCPNCRVAREAVEGEGARYRDMVETPSPPGEGSSGA